MIRRLTGRLSGWMHQLRSKIRVWLSARNKKQLMIKVLPYGMTFLIGDRAACLYRISPGADMGSKLFYVMEHLDRIVGNLMPSIYWQDLLFGAGCAGVLYLLVWQKKNDAKKFRKGMEYGSARWGTSKDIEPYMDPDPWNNIPLTDTESITMASRPKIPKYARNKNIIVIGGSGSGKH